MQYTLFTVFFFKYGFIRNIQLKWTELQMKIIITVFRLMLSVFICFSHVLFSYHPPCLWSSAGQTKWHKSVIFTWNEDFQDCKRERRELLLVRQHREMDWRGEVSAVGNENKWSCVRVWKQICDGKLGKHKSFLKACRPASYCCQNYKCVSLINHTPFTMTAKWCYN